MLKLRSVVTCIALVGLLGTWGCQTYADMLQRGQGYYEQNQYERALAVFRRLEADESSLTSVETVRYCYLRGMTDFRLGYKTDARYWLGLAKASHSKAQGSLQPEETTRLEETLAELNAGVFGEEETDSSQELGQPCKWTSDCDSGFTCKEGTCVVVE